MATGFRFLIGVTFYKAIPWWVSYSSILFCFSYLYSVTKAYMKYISKYRYQLIYS